MPFSRDNASSAPFDLCAQVSQWSALSRQSAKGSAAAPSLPDHRQPVGGGYTLPVHRPPEWILVLGGLLGAALAAAETAARGYAFGRIVPAALPPSNEEARRHVARVQR
jgi:hypothetical protein